MGLLFHQESQNSSQPGMHAEGAEGAGMAVPKAGRIHFLTLKENIPFVEKKLDTFCIGREYFLDTFPTGREYFLTFFTFYYIKFF